MNSLKKKKLGLIGLLAGFTIVTIIGLGRSVYCQEKYPTRAIDIIVSYAPGGGTDAICRLTASYLKKKWNVPVNVINKPGGNTVPANLEVYGAKPDGYTVLADQEGGSSLLEVTLKNLPFKVMDRTFIVMMSRPQHIFMVPFASPFKNLADAMADAKKDPEHFTWTALGGAGIYDIHVKQLFQASGLDISKSQPVMTKGSSQAATLIAGGHVKLGMGTVPACKALVDSGAMRILAILGERSPEMPEIPTTAESGYPTVKLMAWQGFSGPPKLPYHIVNTWEKAVKEIVEDPGFLSEIRKFGYIPFYLSSQDTRNFVSKQIEELTQLFGNK